jgi:hypothetical protein
MIPDTFVTNNRIQKNYIINFKKPALLLLVKRPNNGMAVKSLQALVRPHEPLP